MKRIAILLNLLLILSTANADSVKAEIEETNTIVGKPVLITITARVPIPSSGIDSASSMNMRHITRKAEINTKPNVSGLEINLKNFTYDIEKNNNENVEITRFNYTVTPNKAGDFTIPPFDVKFFLAHPYTSSSNEFVIKTNQLKLKANEITVSTDSSVGANATPAFAISNSSSALKPDTVKVIQGSEATATATLDRNETNIGEHVNLRLITSSDSVIESTPNVLGLKFENKSKSTRFEMKEFKVVKLNEYNYNLTPENSGIYDIPPFEVKLGKNVFKTNPLKLTVKAPTPPPDIALTPIPDKVLTPPPEFVPTKNNNELLQLWNSIQQKCLLNGNYSFFTDEALQFTLLISGMKIHDSPELEFDIGQENLSKFINFVITHSNLLTSGILFFNGAPGLEPNPSEGYKRICKFIEFSSRSPESQREAQFLKGVSMTYGYGTDKNEDEGMRWIRRSAQKGHSPAKDFLIKRGEAVEDSSLELSPKASSEKTNLQHEETAVQSKNLPGDFNMQKIVQKNGMVFQLPSNWSILNSNQKMDLATSNREVHGGKVNEIEFGANLYDTNKKCIALLNTYLYNDIDITKDEISQLSEPDIVFFDNSIKSEIQDFLVGSTSLKKWIGTKKIQINGAPFLLTEYLRTSPNDPLGFNVRLIRYMDLKKSFTLTISYSISEEKSLRPQCDKIINSIIIPTTVKEQTEDLKPDFFPGLREKNIINSKSWPFLLALFTGLAFTIVSCFILSRNGVSILSFFQNLMTNHPWLNFLLIISLIFDISGLSTSVGLIMALPSFALVFLMLGGGMLFRFVLTRKPMGKLAGWLVPSVLYCSWVVVYAFGNEIPYRLTSLMFFCCVAVYRIVQMKTDSDSKLTIYPPPQQP